MKLARGIKIVGLVVAFLAVLTFAAPGYSWTRYDNSGRSYHSGYYHHGGHNYGFRSHYNHWNYGHNYGGTYYPHYRSYYSGPSVWLDFPFFFPGFSFYIAP